MNSQIQIDHEAHVDPEAHEFVTKDRIRLFNERNEYKQKADDFEMELAQSNARSQKVISILLCIAVILIGALSYVLSKP